MVCVYHGKADKALALEHLERIMEFYKEGRDVNFAIIDIRALYGSFMKLMGYLAQTFFPALKQTSLKAQVFVVKDDLIMNHLMSKVVSITNLYSIKTRLFFTLEEAEEWIQEYLKK